jgi:RNA polymerase sigma-70 factor, ECF subfamily
MDMTPAVDRDRRLVESLRLAGPTAAEDLVASYGDRAYRLAIGITGNQPDAEEVVQDALWTVVRKIDTFTGDSAFSSWLHRIVANAAYDKLRGRRGRLDDCSMDELSAIVDEHGESVVDWSSQAQDPALETDLRIVLTAAIEALPEAYRTVVVLRDVQGLPTQEIAQITGLSVANVKVRTHRARLALRRRLSAYLSGTPTGHGLSGHAELPARIGKHRSWEPLPGAVASAALGCPRGVANRRRAKQPSVPALAV